LKVIIDTIVEEADEDPEAKAEMARPEEGEGENEARNLERRRKQMKFTKRLAPILRFLSEEMMQEYFGLRNHEEIWRELNTSADHRSKVIE
jgi:hypothetical protein